MQRNQSVKLPSTRRRVDLTPRKFRYQSFNSPTCSCVSWASSFDETLRDICAIRGFKQKKSKLCALPRAGFDTVHYWGPPPAVWGLRAEPDL